MRDLKKDAVEKEASTAAISSTSVRLIAAALIAGALGAYFLFDLDRFLDLGYIKETQLSFAAYYVAHPLATMTLYFLLYVFITALSIPGASIISLAGGALFGLWIGTMIVWFASIIGATLAFWSSRYLLRDWLQQRFHLQLEAIDRGVKREGLLYLLSLRLLPIFPFFLINLMMGLTAIKTWSYCWVSALGMLCGTVIYVNAGTRLASINSLNDIVTPVCWVLLLYWASFPLLSKRYLADLSDDQVFIGNFINNECLAL